MKSKSKLAMGSVLCAFGGFGVLLSIFTKLPFVSDAIAFGIVFILGVAMGIGVVLVIYNLRSVARSS